MIEGAKLRAFRERRGIGASALARELGQSRSAVADTERRNVGPEAAEQYVNAVLRLAGIRGTVRIQLAVDVPYSIARTIGLELQELL